MKYIEALSEYVPLPDQFSVFLAGGITNCEDWQKRIADFLSFLDVVVLNPRRAEFPRDDPSAAEAQIKWEFEHLKKAKEIIFWFSPETLCPITLFEYGKWLVSEKRLYVGCHPEYKRTQDVRVQTILERPQQIVHSSLESLVNEFKQDFIRKQIEASLPNNT